MLILLAASSRNSTGWRLCRFCDLRTVVSNAVVVETTSRNSNSSQCRTTKYNPPKQQSKSTVVLVPSLFSSLRAATRRRQYHELSFFAETTGGGNNDSLTNNILQYCRDDSQDDLQPPPFPAELAVTTASSRSTNSDSEEESSVAAFSWVRVALEAAPWNPADFNTIQGRYPTPKAVVSSSSSYSSSYSSSQVQPSCPPPLMTASRHFPHRTVAGAQGIGRVTHIVTTRGGGHQHQHQYPFQQQQQQQQHQDIIQQHSSSPSSGGLQIGDWVTVGIPSFGTFRSSVWVPAKTTTTNIVTSTTTIQNNNNNDSSGKSSSAITTTKTTTRSDALLIFKGTTTSKENNGRHIVEEYLRASRHHVAAASLLFQLGGTALRMLRDFVPPQESSTTLIVLQNAANSGVGYMVAQCLRHFYSNNMNTLLVSLVRRGDHRSDAQVKGMVDYLCAASSNHDNVNSNSSNHHCHRRHDHVVLVEDDLLHNNNNNNNNRNDALRIVQADLMERIAKMVSSNRNNPTAPHHSPISFLALNAVGGPSADLLLQLLQRLSSSSSISSSSSPPTMVTYGGMSQQPIAIKTGPLVFDNLALRGYWHSRWLVENTTAEAVASRISTVDSKHSDDDCYHDPRQALLDELVDAAIVQQTIQLPPVDLVSLSSSSSYNDDIVATLMNHSQKQSMQPIRHKLVLDLREETS
jgi:hypothetical protein